MAYPETMERKDYGYGRDYGYDRIPSDLAKLEDLEDFEIADGEVDPRGWALTGPDGEKVGEIKSLLASPTTEKAYFAIVDTGGWFENKLFAIPLEQIRFDRDDRKAYGPYTKEQFRNAPEYRWGERDYDRYYGYWSGFHGAMPSEERTEFGETTERFGEARGEVRVPVTEETAEVRREAHEAGFITVRKRVDVETRHISEPVTRTRVIAEEREVPEGEAYAQAGTTTLREGETLRVPVVEEDVTVEKVPRVTKEVILHTEPETEQIERDVQLRHEDVEIETEGDVEMERAGRAGTRRMP